MIVCFTLQYYCVFFGPWDFRVHFILSVYTNGVVLLNWGYKDQGWKTVIYVYLNTNKNSLIILQNSNF